MAHVDISPAKYCRGFFLFTLISLDAVNCYDEDLTKSFIALTCKVHNIPQSALSQEQKDALKSIMLKSRNYQAAVKNRMNAKKKKK